tara:strand:+ start:106 stop:732 length:627 start_codon:yes stop_codon:yes gene_type:complete
MSVVPASTTRLINSATVTKLGRENVHYVDLIQLHLTDASGNDTMLQYNTGPIDLVVNTPTSGTTLYVAQGDFINFGNLKETADLSVQSFDVLFSAVDTTTLSALVTSDAGLKRISGRQAVFYRVVLGDDYSFSSTDVYMIFDGTIDGYSITEDENTSTLSITCSNNFAKFDSINGRKTNPASQNVRFPNDRGFEFASALKQDIRWGQP